MARKRLSNEQLLGDQRYQKFSEKLEKIQNSQKETIKKISKRFNVPRYFVKSVMYKNDFSKLPVEDQLEIAKTVRRYGYYV